MLSLLTVALALAYWLWQPATLRIAVGPAGSDDQTLVSAIAKASMPKAATVRLVPIETDGTLQSLNLLGGGKADLAVGARRPRHAGRHQFGARSCAGTLWCCGRRRARKGAAQDEGQIGRSRHSAGRRIGVVGRGDANVNLLRVILAEVRRRTRTRCTITQFGTDRISEMAQDSTLDAFMMVGPLDDKAIAETITATARMRGEPKFLSVDVSEAIAARHPLYESEEIPASAFTADAAAARRQDRDRQPSII